MRGQYKDFKYESGLELAAMLQCESLGFHVKHYDLDPIEYWDPIKKKNRKYYPDLIINDFLIVEIKWIGFFYKIKKETIESKRKALEYFCCGSKKYVCLFATNKMIDKKFLKKAREYHEKI